MGTPDRRAWTRRSHRRCRTRPAAPGWRHARGRDPLCTCSAVDKTRSTKSCTHTGSRRIARRRPYRRDRGGSSAGCARQYSCSSCAIACPFTRPHDRPRPGLAHSPRAMMIHAANTVAAQVAMGRVRRPVVGAARADGRGIGAGYGAAHGARCVARVAQRRGSARTDGADRAAGATGARAAPDGRADRIAPAPWRTRRDGGKVERHLGQRDPAGVREHRLQLACER